MHCSSSTHTWDAFQLADASFRLYCVRNNHVLPAKGHKISGELGPCLLGETLKINIEPPAAEAEEDEDGSLDPLPAIKIHDDDFSLRFLVCGVPCTLVCLEILFSSFQDTASLPFKTCSYAVLNLPFICEYMGCSVLTLS